MEHIVGLVGTIEYSADDIRLTPEGEEWVPTEEDPTAGLR
jgi:hypothetical protein